MPAQAALRLQGKATRRYPATALFLLVGAAILWGALRLSAHTRFTQWQVMPSTQSRSFWTPFSWQGERDSSGRMRREAMYIPVHMDGIPRTLWFQFDLGCDYTMLYERTARDVFAAYPACSYKITTIRHLWGKDLPHELRDCRMALNSCTAFNPHCYVRKDYGEALPRETIMNPDSFFRMGTIGADFFQGKTLIIDYPNQRFAVCDSLPAGFSVPLTDISLDEDGRAVLPMKLRGKNYRVIFDNGSSLYPLITVAAKADLFAGGPDLDTTEISSWGEMIPITSRRMRDSFELAGHRFGNVLVYANHGSHGTDEHTDATTGNALFWDRMLIVDFRRKKFGLR